MTLIIKPKKHGRMWQPTHLWVKYNLHINLTACDDVDTEVRRGTAIINYLESHPDVRERYLNKEIDFKDVIQILTEEANVILVAMKADELGLTGEA